MIPRLTLSENTPKIVRTFLAKLRNSKFSGDINHDFASRLVNATDNSIYQLLPQAVIFPKNMEDIRCVLKIADQQQFRKSIKITPRGGGTGTNGQSLTEGVVLDCSRYMNRILEINYKEGWVRVEPGVVLDQLNEHLAPQQVFFAPDLSPSNRATIGGMVNTDACGKGSRIYGRTSDHVLALSCVLSNGEVMQSVQLDPETLHESKRKPGILGEVHKVVDQVVSEKAELIEEIFPKMSRFMTGYNLAKVYANASKNFNMNYLLSGSEGTLAVVCEAKLRLTKLPKYKCLLVVKYETFDDALRDAELLVESDPAAIETIDETILSLAKEDQIYLKIKDYIADEQTETRGKTRKTRTINLVEFCGSNKSKLEKQLTELCKIIAAKKNKSGEATGYFRTADPAEIRDLWSLRKKGVGLLGNTKGRRKPLPFVEDTAVPPENLASYIKEFRALLESYDLEYAMFGHVDVGCLHVRPALDLQNPEEVAWIRELSDKVVELLKKYDGIMWSEHGRGFRSEYTAEFFGEELHQDLRRIKEVFDPNNRLNPGKIVTPLSLKDKVVSLEGPLRGQKDRQINAQLQTEYESVINCNGNGACFDYSPVHVMCPSSRISRDRVHSPQGRAGLMREWLRLLSLQQHETTADNKTKGVFSKVLNMLQNTRLKKNGEDDFSHEVYESMSGCLACKACATQCPVHVNVPEFRAKFLNLYHSRYFHPIKDYLVATTESFGRLFSNIPRLANSLFSWPLSKGLLKNQIGLRDLPLYSPESVRTRLIKSSAPVFDLDKLSSSTPEELGQSVILLQDAFTSFYESQVVMDFYELLRQLDYTVYVAPFHPNGKPLHVKGFLEKFRKVAEQNTKWLSHVALCGIPIVGVDPSIVLTYRDEYLKILEVNEIPFEVMLPQELLCRNSGKLSKHAVSAKKNNNEYHLLGHCTEKTDVQLSQKMWQDVFKSFGLTLQQIQVGCCGMAGTYGHETIHFKESRGIYDLSWKNKIPEDQILRQNILTTGFSCRSQVRRFSGFRPLHPLQALLREIISSKDAKLLNS
ncbi:MAG: FAD-binding oxidoreductase [SAR324 cluster bacterium]|nr:FAD-binding oxidoreductase [SAR324 cluster bacterium]MBL7035171.1 FAD-binding oxidoreductase [SAR324 cluster bacterium]